MGKDKIQAKIDQLYELLEKTKTLDQDDQRVKESIELIKGQIIEYQLDLLNTNEYIPFKTRFINNFLKSKTVILMITLIVFEILSNFTDVFKNSDNEILKFVGVVIPIITIYLRTFQK